uniref:amidohydrolase family protein n=1 Tax=Fodinibius sp. TaxID=1872440 RepID=UPI003569EA60
EAWTGSYDALFHKNIDSVNARLAETCQQYGEGLLVPFGTVNPRWPDWKEDLRRCDEAYGMPGIRLYPSYQNYTLELPEFAELLTEASDREMVVQIAIDQEDERMQHPQVEIPAVDVSPLPAVLESVPDVTVQLLNPFRHVRGDNLESAIKETDVLFGISNLDGNGGLERIMAGNHWYLGSTPIPSDRLLIGSHVPFRPVENVLFKLMESPLDEQEAAAIMSKNAARMLKTV